MDLLKFQTQSGSEFLSDGNQHPPVLWCIPWQLDVCVANRELVVSLRNSVSLTLLDGNNHICLLGKGYAQDPPGHPFASRASCTTFSELTELKLLSEHLEGV